jgi:hypothetical protein
MGSAFQPLSISASAFARYSSLFLFLAMHYRYLFEHPSAVDPRLKCVPIPLADGSRGQNLVKRTESHNASSLR